MRALVATIDAGGNTPPTVAVARELGRRGHEVLVLGHAGQRAAFAAGGLDLHTWQSARPWSPRVNRPGMVSMLSWLRLASDRGYGHDLAATAHERGVDLILVDCMIPGALQGARSVGVPVALLLHAYSGYWRTQWSARSPMGWWLRLTGTHPGRPSALPDLLVVTTLRELDVIDAHDPILDAETAQTGPAFGTLPTHPAAVADDAPLLLSLSTVSYPGQQACAQRVLDALAGLPVRAVATLGSAVDTATLRAPPNVDMLGYAPHAELLPASRAVIGHGGHGTTMLALAHGLPVLMLPMSGYADQPLVAASVTAAGAGLTVSRDATVPEIRRSIHRLVTDPDLRRQAARLGERLRGGNGAAEAATALDDLASRA